MTATTNDKIKNILGIFLVMLVAATWFSFGYSMSNKIEFVNTPIIYNHTIERVEVKECALSCLDARNEGYLDGVAECDMNKMYYEAKDGRYQSLEENINAFNAERVAICVQTRGRTEGEILSAFLEELLHEHLWSATYKEHFCEGGD